MNKFISRTKMLKGFFLIFIFVLSMFILTSCKEDDPVDTSIPTSLTTSVNEATIVVGDSTTITVSAVPSEASNDVIWSVEDSNIATVNEGVVTGISVGTTKVHATSTKDENVKASVTINVVKGILEVKEVPSTLCIGNTYQLDVNSTYGEVVYESLNTNIATVDNNGLVTGVSAGSVTIKVSSVNQPDKSTTIQFKVYNIPEVLKTGNKTTEIFIGSSSKFNLTATPSGSLTKVTWVSSNPEVLTIDENGRVTGISEGVATITGTSVVNPNVKFERTIRVKTPASSVEVTAEDNTEAIIGQTIQLHAQVFPLNVSNTVTWSSPNENVATVDENGLVTITGIGEVVITASSTVTTYVKGQIKIKGLHELLNEEQSDVKYILCAPGTDASTSISINYHAKNTKTFIEYTVASDTEFSNCKTYIPEGKFFEELDEALDGPFEARNIYSAEITGLTPGTKYIYRINCGDGTYSDVYQFTTASGSGNFSFLWLTDNHYHYLQGEDTTGPEISEQTIAKALGMRPDLAFVFDTGDMIDTGGNSNIWDLMFRKRLSLKQLPLVSTTGNHELYIASTGQWDNRFHAAYNALPKNGIEEKVGTSCYYYYNDTLFIVIENMNNSGYDKQLAWMEEQFIETRINGKAKYIIIGMHGPIQEEGNTDRDETMMALFEKYSVDLVLTGHYHTDEETRDYYEGTTSSNPLLGVNYMIGSVAGAKGVGSNDPAVFAKGYVVDVTDEGIKVTKIDANGKVYYTRTYTSKLGEEVSSDAKNATKDDIMNSFKYSLNTQTNKITFTWSSLAYGNATQVVIEETNRADEKNNRYILNSAYTNLTLNNCLNYYDSKYLITVYFNDGTTMTKEIVVSRNTNININVSNITENSAYLTFDPVHASIEYVVKNVQVYVNGVLVNTHPYLSSGLAMTSLQVNNLESNKDYTIKLVAINGNGGIVFENEVSFKTK